MAVFQPFPRLYEQQSNTTQNYYGGLGRTPVTGTYAGNQNPGALSRTSVATPNTTMPLNQTPTPTPQPTTQPPANRPAYGTLGLQGDGSMGAYADVLTPEDWAKLNGRYLAGNAYDNGLIIDPSQLEYDERLGWITGKDNIREDNSGLFRYGRLGNIALGVGAVLGGAGIANAALGAGAGVGAGAAPTVAATDIAMPGLAGAANPALSAAPALGGAATAAGAGAAGVTAADIAMPTLTGAANPALSAAPTIAGGSSLPFGLTARDIAGVGLPLYNAIRRRGGDDAYNRAIADAANRGDPYGPYRERGAQRLHDLEANPNAITETPEYQFLQQQGEQGIERMANKTGYFRSPNMLFDLSKFNQNLASTEYQKAWERYAREAGIQFDPSASARIAADGARQSDNMRQSETTAWMDFGRSVVDWFTRRPA